MSALKKELANNTKDELLDICKDKGIICRKSWNKRKIIQALLESSTTRKKSKKTKKSSKIKKSQQKSSKKKSSKKTTLKDGLECDMSTDKCEKSNKYIKADIIALAEKCGVDTSGTRKQICARIAKSLSSDEDDGNTILSTCYRAT